jgi:hypothetical protein
VLDIKLASEFFTIQVFGASIDSNAHEFCKILTDEFHNTPNFSTVIRRSERGGWIIEVRVPNSWWATEVVEACKVIRLTHPGLSVREIVGGVENSSTASRVQLSTVTCTWYEPSRVAFLVYSNETKFVTATHALRTMKTLNRTPSVVLQESAIREGKLRYKLRLKNLSGWTTLRDIRDKLFGNIAPENIAFSAP